MRRNIRSRWRISRFHSWPNYMHSSMSGMIMGYGLGICLLLGNAGKLCAGGLTFDGQVRERFEYFDGLNKKAYGNHSIDAKGKKRGESDDRLLVQRIIVGFTYNQSRRITYSLHMYDARVRGWSLDEDDFIKNRGTSDEFVMDPYEDHFELHDANIQIRDLLFNGFGAIIGRQKIWYGDKRIFGPGGWGNSIGWLWDAARFSYKYKDNFVDAWYGQTKTKDPDSFSLIHKHAYQGIGVYSHFVLTRSGSLEPFFAWKNNLFHNDHPEERTIYYGARFVEPNLYGVNLDLTYVRESGRIWDKNVRAYAYVTKVGYKFRHLPMKPNVVLGRVFASGDSCPSDGTIKTFVRPFGSTDGEHYGRMDIMFWSNLVDNQISLYLKPTKRSNLKIAYHHFSMDKSQDTWSYYKYKNKPGNSYTHLGEELDFQIKHKVSNALNLQFIYAYFRPGDFVRMNVEDNNAQRIFIQFTYKFKKSTATAQGNGN